MRFSISTFTDFFFPPQCVHCRREGAWLCPQGLSEVQKIQPMIDPLQLTGIDRVLCAGDYDLPLLGRFIQGLKYDFWTAPARTIVPLLFAQLANQLPAEATIVPIPLHWRRRLARGFNQSELIARPLAQCTGQPVSPLLQRHRFTTPQATLKAQQRVTNVAGAFRVRPMREIPTSIILVDDVITTGSTIEACAAVLRAAGVKYITAIALAKG